MTYKVGSLFFSFLFLAVGRLLFFAHCACIWTLFSHDDHDKAK